MKTEFQFTLTLKELMRLNAIIAEHCSRQNPNNTMPEELKSLQIKIADTLMEM
jgi:hypothetical protein